jgi:hypothetical protein
VKVRSDRRCCWCGVVYAVGSLAQDCEDRHDEELYSDTE